MQERKTKVILAVLWILGWAALAHAATVAAPTFSKAHGFYDASFSVQISSATAGATIRYTTDGAAPTSTLGTVLANGGSVTVSTTTPLRAVACKSGMTDSDVFTQTYIFLSQVLAQPGRPSGYPSWWPYNIPNFGAAKGVTGNYGMDQTKRSQIGDTKLKNALKSIPTLSLVVNRSDMFNPTWVYGQWSNETIKERPVSVELIYPDGAAGFQEDCAVRSHSHGMEKRALRLLFKSGFGPTQLNYPIFEKATLHATTKQGFDKLILRAGCNANYSIEEGDNRVFVRDSWVRATQIQMAGYGSHGLFVHLYINGLYWGWYDVAERPDDGFTSLWFGGSKSDWYAGHHAGDISGNDDRFDSMVAAAQQGNYATVKTLLDMNNFFDYIMLCNYVAAKDWPRNNYYYGMRNNPADKARFLNWDAEICWGHPEDGGVAGGRVDGAWVHPVLRPSHTATSSEKNSPIYKIWHGLRGNSAFIEDFSRRVDVHCYGTGALTESKCRSRWTTLCSAVDLPMYAEIVRWGGSNTDHGDWEAERDLVYNMMAGNVQQFINALKQHGYYKDAAPQPPAAPSSLAAATQSTTSIRLTWNDNSSNETGFKVERSLTGSSGWLQITAPGANTTAYTDSGLSSGTTYYYRVRASNSAGDSGYSNVASATTGQSAPAAPGSLAAAAQSATSIRLTWTDNSGNETGFKIDRRKSGTDTWERIATPSANATAYTDSGLASGTLYYYMVKATNGAGDSSYSNTASATTGESAPAAPGSLAAAAQSATSIRLTWTDNSGNETGFKIDRRESGTDTWARIATPSANATAYTDSGLLSGTLYYYMVKATNGAGDSPYSNVAGATTGESAPTAPGSLAAASQSATSIRLTWADNSSNETGFKIDWRQSGTDTWERIATPGANATAYTDSGLASGTLYYYMVKATNGAGDSPYSNVAGATTGESAPTAPGSLAAAAQSATSIGLTWADNSSNETGFKIDRRESGTDTWERIATPSANATAYTDSGLASGTLYYYMVKATNGAGDSPYSNTASATTGESAPTAPGSLAAAAQSATSIGLTWADNSSNETGFKIDRRESGTDTWERIATPSANATAYTDSGLLSGTLYYYKAKAYNATGDSAYTAVAAATTPSMSGLVIISARFGKAGAWLDVTDGMREKTVDGCLYYHVADAFVDFGDPAPGAEKVLELQYQLDGQAATSTTAEGEIILINPPPPVPVCRAKLLSATYGVEGVAMVDCTEDLRNFIMGNKLYFNTFSANSVFGDPVPGASKTLVLDYYDQDNVRRTLRSPEEGAGSKFTLVFSETPIGPPATPGNPVASALDAGRIRLTWADSSDNETGFKIDRRQSGTDPWVRVAEPAANATAYTDNGLPAGTKFYYKVKAWNAAGDSAYTAVAFATTETGQPPSEWVAYNDLAWSAGQPTVNITTYTTTNGFAAGVNMGPLVDHSTGQETGVQLLITGGDGMAGSQGAHPASGTDAHEVFDGKVNCVGTISYGSQDLSLTFTGLDPALRYQLVLYADRNGAGYVGASARGHYGTLLGAQSFKNQSTAGALIVTDAGNHQPDDTTLYNAGYNGASGLVTRFTQIEPGTDGRIVLRLKQGGAAEYEHYFARCYTYANAVALMVQDSFLPAAEDADADAIADAWEASHFGSTSVLDAGSAQDSDGDGLRDVDEYITGTDPTNTASCFAVQVGLSAGNVVVSFPTVQATGAGYANVTRHYTLESSSGTGDTAAWQAVAGYANLPATGETVVYTNAGADSVLVYRARVWLESLE